MPHLDEDQLTVLLDGELPPDQRRMAETHLASCAECRRLYEEVRAISGEADALIAAVEPPRRTRTPPASATPPPAGASPSRRRLPWRSLAWAATLVAALGLGYLVRGGRSASVSDIDTPAATAPPPSEPAVPAPATQPVADQAGPKPADSDERVATAPPARRDAESAAVPSGMRLAEADAPTPTGAVGAPTAPAAVGSAKQANAAPVAAFHQVTMEEAVRSLGGSIRLLDGLEPERVLTGPGRLLPGAAPDLPVVRVVYEDPPGRELWLDQQRAIREERAAPAAGALSLLPGDTVITPPARGMQSVSWIDQAGFRLALTGFLPADSLRGLMRRVE